MLFDGHEVILGAVTLGVLGLTEFAKNSLELINDMLGFILKK